MNLFHEGKKILDKDGKVNPLGPYGKQKLTGREISTYFRRNKVKDPEVKKAVEVALDLGGAMDIATKEIMKFYGSKVANSKEVQTALKYANEEFQIAEDYKKVIKMYPRDNDWKKLITKHRKAIDDFRNKNKDLPKKVEDELIDWASQTGAVGHKDDVEDFIMDILDEGTISEKFKPYNDKQYPRCVDFYIQFRGGKGDRITSEENKKDFEKAKKMIDAYCKSNKIKQKPVYSTPQEGSSAYKVGLMIDSTYSKTSDYKDLANKIGISFFNKKITNKKIKFSSQSIGRFSVEEGKDKIKYRGNLKGLKEETISEGKNLMPDVQKIVDTKGAAKVGGIMIDMFTASMITQIYSKVNDQNKKKMEKSNISTLVDLAQRMMQKMGDNMEGNTISEEVQDITVDPKNKKFSSPSDQNYHGMEIAKAARRFKLKAAVLGKHVRIKGNKKQVNDFLRVVIGKSSYGDPTNGDYTTPQIDKMLTKGMK